MSVSAANATMTGFSGPTGHRRGLVVAVIGFCTMAGSPGCEPTPSMVGGEQAEKGHGRLLTEYRIREYGGRRMVFSPKGDRVAVTDGKNVDVWKVVDGKREHALMGAQEEITALAYSSDAKWLAAAGGDRRIIVWDVTTGDRVRSYDVPEHPSGRTWTSALAIRSPGHVRSCWVGGETWDVWEHVPGMRLVVGKPYNDKWQQRGWLTGFCGVLGGRDESFLVGRIRVGPKSRSGLTLLGASGYGAIDLPMVGSWDRSVRVAGCRAGGVAAAGGDCGVVDIVDMWTGKQLTSFRSQGARITLLALSDSGRYLVSVVEDGTYILHDLGIGETIFENRSKSRIKAVAVSPDGGMLGLADEKGCVFLIEVPARHQLSAPAATSGEISRWWALLGNPDAQIAYAATKQLMAHPQATLQIAGATLQALGPVDRRNMETLIAQLKSGQQAARAKALEGLLAEGELAMPALRDEMARSQDRDAKLCIEGVMAAGGGYWLISKDLAVARSVQLLEWLGDPEAGKIIDRVAQGDQGRLGTRLAAEARRRMELRLLTTSRQ